MRGGGVSKWVFLNSAVWYIVSLGFLFYRSFANAQDDRNTLRMTRARSGLQELVQDDKGMLRMKSKSCRYNKCPILKGAEPGASVQKITVLCTHGAENRAKCMDTDSVGTNIGGFPYRRYA